MMKKGLILILIAGVCLVFIILYSFFSKEKIDPAVVQSPFHSSFSPESTTKVTVTRIIDWYEAVGTIRPRTEASIQAQVTAQVIDVLVKSGDRVQKGQLLISLDNRQFLSRLDQVRESLKAAAAGEKQAKQAVIASGAAFSEAKLAYNRTKNYFKSQAATSQDLEKAESTYLQAQAGLKRTKEALAGASAMIRKTQQVVNEAEIALGYTKIKAPASGEVLNRLVEPGDLALPGKPLITLRTSGLLRLEAYVREGLIEKVKPGIQLRVDISTLNRIVDAVVEEIVPYADPHTRTFLVKVSLPHIPGLYPGMFGKLLIPAREHSAVTIPKESVRQVGQLELVWIKDKKGWKTRYIKTGRATDGNIEVLSGLSGDEIIGWGGATK